MNRRTFLAGLATTTAMVAAGGAPAPPIKASRGTIEGVKFILDDEWAVGPMMRPPRLMGYIGAADLNARWMERLEAASRDDRILYGRAFHRLPDLMRIDPFDVTVLPDPADPDGKATLDGRPVLTRRLVATEELS